MSAGTRLVDKFKFVSGFGPAIPSTSTSSYVGLKFYNHATILIDALNGGSGVTAGAITLNQAQDASGTGAKPLGFTTVFANADTGASDVLVSTPVVSNTFTPTTTASKDSQYILEVNANDLDVNNGYCYLQVAMATGTAQTLNVDYILAGARYGGNFAQFPSAIV